MIHTVPSITQHKAKRLGRGHGSGRGKTAGRGTKGQKARGTIPPHFEGGQLSVMKRLPYLRGKLRNKSRTAKPVILHVGSLADFPKGATVTLEALKKHGIVKEGASRVKILSGGSLSTPLTVSIACSEGARKAIEKAGGKLVPNV